MKTNKANKQQPVLITLKDASEKLRISRQTITNWMDAGAMPGLRTSNSIWVSKEAVDILCSSELNNLQDEIDKLSETYKKKLDELHSMENDVNEKISHMTNIFEQCTVPEALSVIKKTMVKMFSDVLNDHQIKVVENLTSGMSIQDVAEKYGYSVKSVWNIFNRAIYIMSQNALKVDENKNLRKENDRLKEEHEIMKKAYLEIRQKNEQLDAELQVHNIICGNVELSRENMLTEEEKHLVILFQTPIYDLNFSARVHNILVGNRIDTLGDLVKRTKLDLIKLGGLGQRSLREIEDVIEELDLSFGMDVNNVLLRKADECAAK